MSGIEPIMTRVAYVSTEHTGGTLDVNGPEGQLQARRVDPHGVVLMLGAQSISVHKDLLPILGRFFFAAAMLQGVEINEGWDATQVGGA
jgi:hypothetical protein